MLRAHADLHSVPHVCLTGLTGCRYTLDGQISRCNRRDMRRGKMQGRVQLTARGVVCLVRWDDPLPGWGVELFELVDGDLITTSQMFMSGRHEAYKTVYVRPNR